MKLRLLLCCFLFLPYYLGAVTNLFLNTSGDELWSNASNWSLGIIPDSTMDVTISGAVSLLKIPASFHAKCKQLHVTATVRVLAGGTMSVFSKININVSDGELVNNGKIILKPGNYGIYVTLGGTLTNNESDTILIQSTSKDLALINYPIDCRGGKVNNRGYIYISDCDELQAIFMTHITGYYGKISNKILGKIVIDESVDAAIWVADTFENLGIIDISNTTAVSNVNYKSTAIYISDNFSKVFNSGTINISNAGDYGIHLDGGSLTNEATGIINITGFDEIGFYNQGIFTTFGDFNIESSSAILYNKGIHLFEGSSFFKNGSRTTITGNNALYYGIYADRNFVNDTGSIVTINALKAKGFYTNSSLFTNHGSFIVNNSNTQYFTGIELLNSVFTNYGLINMTSCYSGLRVNTGHTAQNYGDMIFKNMPSYGVNSNNNFQNHTGASITCFHNDGLPGFSSGIWHIKDNGIGEFVNDGSINLVNLYIGIDFRTGSIINNNVILISNVKWGIEFGAFAEVATFTNNGTCTINNQNDPAAASINIESLYNNIYNFVNASGANLNITDSGSGIRIFNGGMKNDGNVLIRDVTERAINCLPTNSNTYHFKNSATGVINIDTASYGVFFDINTSNTNRIPVINDGTFIFNHITNDAIDGSNVYMGFTNNGTIAGSCILDCDYVTIQNNIKPGNNSIGIINPINYQSTNPTFLMDIKGIAGAGANNGHDLVIFSAPVTVSGQLTVSLLNGFIPALGNEFIIFFSTSTIAGTFSTVNLPTISSDKEFEVQYLADKIKLVVVQKYVVWTGAVSSAWNNAANWSSNSVPDSLTYVKIVNAVNDPVLGTGTFVINKGTATGIFRCKQLIIENGAIITFNNTVVNNYGTINIYGTVVHNDVNTGQIKNWPGSIMNIFSGGQLNLSQ